MKTVLLKHLGISHIWTTYIIRCLPDYSKKETDILSNLISKLLLNTGGIIIIIILINKTCKYCILQFYSILEINALLIFLPFSLCSLIIVIIIIRFALSYFAEGRGTITYPRLSYLLLLWFPSASNQASTFYPSII